MVSGEACVRGSILDAAATVDYEIAAIDDSLAQVLTIQIKPPIAAPQIAYTVRFPTGRLP
ncbi:MULTISPECIES: hypothetical protein [Pseudomonas syringae group]|uniref:hypothetical protein n=1 Tax=Pseudomonas syringae group TaxID=136849 RepID=UPI000F039331|nr:MULTISPECIES: hypothetical protein [Pseudomonas syringae group]MCZ0945903.1 hypothetical protein [Pseudomonas syringae pv. tomato]